MIAAKGDYTIVFLPTEIMQRFFSNVLYVGIACAVVGNVVISIGICLQKYVHMKSDGSKPYYTKPLWWMGMIALVSGEMLNFAAYGFAPATVIPPLGVVSVIMTSIVSVFFFRETLGYREWTGYALALGGIGCLFAIAPAQDNQLSIDKLLTLLNDPIFIIQSAVLVSFIAILWGRRLAMRSSTSENSWTGSILLASSVGSVTVMCTKAVSSLVVDLIVEGDSIKRKGGTFVLFLIVGSVLVVCAVASVAFLNDALAQGPSSKVIPFHFVTFNFFTIVGCGLLYKEWRYYHQSAITATIFLLGCSLIYLGVAMITSNKGTESENIADWASKVIRQGNILDPDKEKKPLLDAERNATQPE